ncbi:hypothetical protein GCM10020366_16150 [Saccharopolyspora gregorii]|uniref:Uncharacterized protein n=1 Tax=Saccharopolyspora gregorii TaxID=33914 RepID=A0ABP6RKC2_9PSEU
MIAADVPVAEFRGRFPTCGDRSGSLRAIPQEVVRRCRADYVASRCEPRRAIIGRDRREQCPRR